MSEFEIPPVWFADVIAAGQAEYTMAGTVCTVAGVREIARRTVVAELRRLAEEIERSARPANSYILTEAADLMRDRADELDPKGAEDTIRGLLHETRGMHGH